MKLYYASGACSLADHIALIEAGLPYTLEKVDLRAKKIEDGSDYLAVNPKGYVPALETDAGEVLTENLALLNYIADVSGKLMPRDGLARYRMIEATAFVSGELHKNFKPFFNPNASDAERDEAKTVLVRRFGQIAEVLGDSAYLGGDAIGTADCYLYVTMRWAKARGVPLPANLEAAFERFQRHPSILRALSEEGLDQAA